jgi:hypothetical protein
MSDHAHTPPPGESPGYWDDPKRVDRLLKGFFAACALLMLIDVTILVGSHVRHSSFEHGEPAEAATAAGAGEHGAAEPGHETEASGMAAAVEKAEMFPTFYGLYGFVSCVLLVVAAKELRKVLMRSEDYYDRR